MGIAPYPNDGWVLSRVANGFFWVGVSFYRTGEVCKDRFLIDNLVPFLWSGYYYCWHEEGSPPLSINDSTDYVSWTQKGLGQFFRDLDVDLWYTVQRSISLFDHWTINELIGRVWSEWNDFRNDPVYYGRKKVLQSLDRDQGYAITWGAWRRQVLDALLPDLQRFLDDPGGFVRGTLSDALASITAFLNDPMTQVVNWLNAKAEWFSGFLTDPWRKIRDLARRVDEDVYQFLLDPRGRLQSWLNSWLGLPGGFWADPRSGVLDWLIWHWSANFAVYRERLYMRVHELLQHVLDDEYW